MNALSTFLHEIALAFEHFIGDPVHSQAATAIKTTLQSAASAVEAGAEDAVLKLQDAVTEVIGQPRAATPEDWAGLHKTAVAVKTSIGNVAVSQASPPAVEKPLTDSTEVAPPAESHSTPPPAPQTTTSAS